MSINVAAAVQGFFYKTKRRLKKFHDPGFPLRGAGFLSAAALLEYPQNCLEYLHDCNAVNPVRNSSGALNPAAEQWGIISNGANHHYGEWDAIFRNCGTEKPVYDLWLDKYKNIIEDSKDTAIIDLGCGYGNDTLYLHERGYKVISCDLSKEALDRLEHVIVAPITKHFDMLEGLPFEKGTAKIIIADLSMHYFLWEDTERIVEEIKRVLTNGGFFFCRVNSVNAAIHGAGRGIKIEENYYMVNGRRKRFFDKKGLEKLFRAWDMISIDEYSLDRFGSTKILYEVAAQKRERNETVYNQQSVFISSAWTAWRQICSKFINNMAAQTILHRTEIKL